MVPPMRPRRFLVALALGACSVLAACSAESDPEGDDPSLSEENAVRVDTSSPQARAQYDANVAFVNGYRARCTAPRTGKKRVLVTGFGRFQSITDNATGRMVAGLLPDLAYPETAAPPAGEIDPPAKQLAVGFGTVRLPISGDVEVCAMVLPVFWDLAAVLAAKEIEAFGPDMVLMNGVAGGRQDVWIELGAVNKAATLDDGSDQLRPLPDDPSRQAPILTRGPAERANLLSWSSTLAAAKASREASADEREGGVRFGDVVLGAKLAGYPRGSNTYLCNNITYVVGYLMDNPGTTVSLLRASVRVAGKSNDVRARISRDMRTTPRVFMHWPSELARVHTARGRGLMLGVIDAQIAHPASDAPTRGKKADAAPDLAGGPTF